MRQITSNFSEFHLVKPDCLDGQLRHFLIWRQLENQGRGTRMNTVHKPFSWSFRMHLYAHTWSGCKNPRRCSQLALVYRHEWLYSRYEVITLNIFPREVVKGLSVINHLYVWGSWQSSVAWPERSTLYKKWRRRKLICFSSSSQSLLDSIKARILSRETNAPFLERLDKEAFFTNVSILHLLEVVLLVQLQSGYIGEMQLRELPRSSADLD